MKVKKVISIIICVALLLAGAGIYMIFSSAPKKQSTYTKVLEEDGFIYGINVPWFTSESKGKNIGNNSRYSEPTVFSEKKVTEVFRNCSAIGFNAIRIPLFAEMEGIVFDDKGNVVKLDTLFVTNIKKILDIARNEKISLDFIIQPSIGYSFYTGENSGDKSEYDLKTQMLVNNNARNTYLNNAITPLCSILKDYQDVLLAVEVSSSPENDVYLETYCSVGTEKNVMNNFLKDIKSGIKKNLPDITVALSVGNSQVFEYSEGGYDVIGVSAYNDKSDVIPVESYKANSALWITEFGAEDASNSSDDFQTKSVVQFYKNAKLAGYSGAFYWQYGYKDTNGDSLSLVSNSTGELRPVSTAIHFNILQNYYDANGIEEVADEPTMLFCDDVLNIRFIGSRDADYYVAERSEDGENWQAISEDIKAYKIDNGFNICTYKDASAKDGVDYWYRIKVVTMDGLSATSKPSKPILKKVVCSDEENLIKNGGFETGDKQPFVFRDKNADVLTGEEGINVHSGKFAAYMDGSNTWVGIEQLISVEKKTFYTFTVYIKCISKPDAWGGYIFVRDKNGKSLQQKVEYNLSSTENDNWNRYTFEVYSGDYSKLLISVINGGREQYVDDFYFFRNNEQGKIPDEAPIKEFNPDNEPDTKLEANPDVKNLIVNGSFENGNLDDYKVAMKDISIIEGVPGGKARTGTHAAYIAGTDPFKYFRQIVDVQKNTDYKAIVFVKANSVSGAYAGYMQILNKAGVPFAEAYKQKFSQTPNGKWKKYVLDFNSGDNAKISLQIMAEGYQMYIDDLYVYQTSPSPEPEPDPVVDNLIKNGDFETGEYLNDYKTTATAASMSVVSDIKHSGEYSLHVNGSEQFKFFRQSFNVTPNTDYVMSMWVMRENVDGAYRGNVEITDGAGGPVSSDYKVYLNIDPCGKWEKVIIKFNSGSLNSMSVKVTNEGHKMWFDDILVYDPNAIPGSKPTPEPEPNPEPEPEPDPDVENLIKNGNFETGEYATNYKTTATSASMSVVSDVKHSGEYSLYVNGSEKFKFFRQAFNVTSDTDYVMSMWVMRENVDGAYRGNVEITDGAGGPVSSDYKAYLNIEPCGKWQKITIKFNSGKLTAMSIKITNEGHKMWFDDILIYNPNGESKPNPDPNPEPDVENLIKNGNFETGEYLANYKSTATAASMSVVSDIKHSGKYSLYVNGSERFKFFRQAFTVTPNTDYVMSMWVRRENVDGAYRGNVEITDGIGTPINTNYKTFLNIEPCGEWQKITINFNSQSLTSMSIKVTNEGHKMWFDDILIYKKQ